MSKQLSHVGHLMVSRGIRHCVDIGFPYPASGIDLLVTRHLGMRS